jgi:hypothetical protein
MAGGEGRQPGSEDEVQVVIEARRAAGFIPPL